MNEHQENERCGEHRPVSARALTSRLSAALQRLRAAVAAVDAPWPKAAGSDEMNELNYALSDVEYEALNRVPSERHAPIATNHRDERSGL